MTRSLDGDLSVVLGSGGGGGRYQMVFFICVVCFGY